MPKILGLVLLLSIQNIFSNPIDENISRFFQFDELDPYFNEQESLFQQLTTVCQEDLECLILARFSSQFCVRSVENICQSDCKYFLKYISEEYANVWDQDQLDLPEDCIPPAWRKSSRCDELDHDGDDEPHCSVHFNVQFDEDEISRIHVESKTVNSAQSAICYADDDVSKAITPGTIRRKPCSDLYHYVQGDIVQVCTNQGHLIQNRASCYSDLGAEHLNEDTGVYRALTARENKTVNELEKITPYVEKGKEYLGKVKDFLSNEKVQSLLPIAGKIAAALGPIGVAFSVALAFLPTPEQPDLKHEEIMNQFKVLEDMSNQILQKVSGIKLEVRKELLDVKLMTMVTSLQNLEMKIGWFAKNATEFSKSEMKKACASYPAENLVGEYHSYVHTKDDKYLAELFDFDRSQILNQFGRQIIGNTVRAITAAIQCKSLDKLATPTDLQTFANNLQKLVQDTVQKIQDIHDHYIPAHFAVYGLEIDVNATLNKGPNDYQQLSDKMYDQLSKKFDFFHWAVAVYEGTKSNEKRATATDCFKCVGDKNSGSYFIEDVKGKNLQVFYSNTEDKFQKERILEIVKYNRRIDLTGVAIGLQKAGMRNVLVVKYDRSLKVTPKTASKFYHREDFQDLIMLTTS